MKRYVLIALLAGLLAFSHAYSGCQKERAHRAERRAVAAENEAQRLAAEGMAKDLDLEAARLKVARAESLLAVRIEDSSREVVRYRTLVARYASQKGAVVNPLADEKPVTQGDLLAACDRAVVGIEKSLAACQGVADAYRAQNTILADQARSFRAASENALRSAQARKEQVRYLERQVAAPTGTLSATVDATVLPYARAGSAFGGAALRVGGVEVGGGYAALYTPSETLHGPAVRVSFRRKLF